jgi:hypothetical protein
MLAYFTLEIKFIKKGGFEKMHRLHCILVELPAEFHEENLSPTKVQEAVQTARRIAM